MDRKYSGFPDFAHWCSARNTRREQVWDRFSSRLHRLRENCSPEIFEEATRRLRRIMAIDTGALERLYPTDRGFTMSVAATAAAWNEAATHSGDDRALYLLAQYEALDLMLDAATRRTDTVGGAFSEHLIRQVHAVLTQPQSDVEVQFPDGTRKHHPLLKGEYKREPNNVETSKGTFEYAPPADTAFEIQRLVETARTPLFEAAHPVSQASWIHYALILIHPFQDGNGRTARALASIFLLRSVSVPLIVYADQRDRYLDALEEAGSGNHRAFWSFILDRTLDTIGLLVEILQQSQVPSLDTATRELRSALLPRGHLNDDLDNAGSRLLAVVEDRLSTRAKQIDLECEHRIEFEEVGNGPELGIWLEGLTIEESDYRVFENGSNSSVGCWALSGPTPLELTFQLEIMVAQSVDAPYDLIVGANVDCSQSFGCDYSELSPQMSEALERRLGVWIDALLARLVEAMNRRVQDSKHPPSGGEER